LAERYGVLLLHKLSAISRDDDLNALAEMLQAAPPSDLFSAREEARIIAISRRHWETAQRHRHPLLELEHPLARRWLE
jgi:hypothetical protein